MLKVICAAVTIASAGAASAGEYELKWDDGTLGAFFQVRGVGEGYWLGNDFNAGTLGNTVVRLRATAAKSDNGRWDGFRVALFAFDGVPGSIIWPESGVPKFVLPSSTNNWSWVEVSVNWTLPAGKTAFVAAHEVYYYYPDNDEYCFDHSPAYPGHTWNAYPGRNWYNYTQPYLGTLMMRAVVAGGTAVSPGSLGRVKALFR
jgi:hypothetical protein